MSNVVTNAVLAETKQNQVFLVGVDFGEPMFDAQLQELSLLAQSAGLKPVGKLSCKRQVPDAAFFVGKGKVEEIKAELALCQATEVWFDQALSPIQQRNLEKALQVPVNDRIFLILEIFAQRARSFEGRLQVELARLQYLATRLVRRWSHLERQQGGIGTRGGPGETQIELDRRMIANAIKRTKERLVKVKRQRQTQRKRRISGDNLSVSLVGYTNAGKSTLFNALVKAKAHAADQLFATLDTTTRKLYLGSDEQQQSKFASLSDTVGFIRNLPHNLVAAFEATLQEAVEADLLLHVVDAASEHAHEQMQEVIQVLKDIGADHLPQVLVFNKIDAVDSDNQPVKWRDEYMLDDKLYPRVFVSALTGAGLTELRQILLEQRQKTS